MSGTAKHQMVKYEIEFPKEALTHNGVEYEPTAKATFARQSLGMVFCTIILRHKAPPYDWGKMTGWGFAKDANGEVWYYENEPNFDQKRGRWLFPTGEAFNPRQLNSLGIPIPEIPDWKTPLINPNWKGAN